MTETPVCLVQYSSRVPQIYLYYFYLEFLKPEVKNQAGKPHC